jgi:hypothetical protein
MFIATSFVKVLRRPLESAQYTSIEFGHRCREAGVRPSMGSVGDAYDNAMCESFFATLECELLDRRRSGEELKTYRNGYSSLKDGDRCGLVSMGYYRTKTLECITVFEQNAEVFVSLAGPHGEVRTMSLRSLNESDRWVGGESGAYVKCLAVGCIDGTTVVYGGDDRGSLFARDVAGKREYGKQQRYAHSGKVPRRSILCLCHVLRPRPNRRSLARDRQHGIGPVRQGVFGDDLLRPDGRGSSEGREQGEREKSALPV